MTAYEAVPAAGTATTTRPVRCWLPDDPPNLDPHGGVDEWSMRLHAAVFEGLFRPGPDGTAVPGLAERARVSDDGRTVDVTLRPGLCWSDGAPLTAHDFLTTVERAVEPGTPLRAAWQMYPIGGARERHRGEAGPQLGVEVVADTELRLTLAEPMPCVEELLMLPALAPLRADRLPPLPGTGSLDDWWRTVPASGPYRPAEPAGGARYRFVRNERHWDAGRLPPHPLEYRIGGDPLRRYADGEVDVVSLDPERLAALPDGWLSPDRLTRVTEGTAVFAAVNTGRPEFAEQAVRDALAYSLDRERLIEAAGSPALPLARLVPATPGGAGYLAEHPLAAATGRPEPLLRGTTLVLNCGSSPGQVREARALAGQLAAGTGAEIEVNPLSYFDLYWSVKRGDYQLALLAWRADFDDPLACLREHVSDGAAGNQSKWSDPAYDGLIARARRTAEGPARRALLAEAERRVLAHHAVLPLWQRRRSWLIRPGLSGAVFRATGTAVDLRWAHW